MFYPSRSGSSPLNANSHGERDQTSDLTINLLFLRMRDTRDLLAPNFSSMNLHFNLFLWSDISSRTSTFITSHHSLPVISLIARPRVSFAARRTIGLEDLPPINLEITGREASATRLARLTSRALMHR